MQKLRFLFLLLLFPSILFAQQPRTKIILERSELANVDNKTKITKLKLPIFSHDGSILTCDSANFFTERNYFEAYGNVHINQGDTLNIFSDLLTYDGNTKQAHLSDNVRLVDRSSTLTTNVLDYNLGTKYGTYINGGKIVNKEATVTSKNGYYFANTKDAYFRYNVVVVTAQSTIKSDTLRYNTFTNWTYFYGPTNIKGKDDNLYTENGAYNTKNENAYFGKKNLYTQNTKSLKGDSLYYNGKTGYGKAVKNIIFMDSSDKTLLHGQLGEYYKADERVVVTKNAWFAMGTKDSIIVNQKKIPDSLFLGADTLEAQKVLQKTLKVLNKPIVEKDNEIGAEDAKQKELKDKEKAEAKKQFELEKKAKKPTLTTTTPKKLSRKERKEAEKLAELKKKSPPLPNDSTHTDSLKIKTDSIKVKPDSVRRDSLKNSIANSSSVKSVAAKKDSVNSASSKTTNAQKAKPAIGNQLKTTALTEKKDSVVVFNPADTVRTRVIKAFHNVRVYKSNLQAMADSLFYTAADSALRWYKNPMLWSDGTQQTGDTIHVFFKNDKIHSFQVFPNGFIVNVEGDSTKFNQVKGKKITGFLANGELRNIYVDGNAESMYYNKDAKGNYDNLSHSISSRIKFNFYNKELTDIITIKEVEGAVDPMDKLPKETLLTGFIWKPEWRPVSKADIIKGRPRVIKPVDKSKTTTEKDTKGTKSKVPVKQAKDNKPTQKQVTPVEEKTTPPAKIDSLKTKQGQ